MPRKPWTKMSAAELAKATKEFDRGSGPAAIAPSAAELAKHRRALRPATKRGRGRPALANGGAARVLFTIDPRLLARLDAFARKHHMKRSRLLAVSVEAYMKAGNPMDHAGRGASEPFSATPLAAAAR